MDFIRKFLFDGFIPHFSLIRKIALILSFSPIPLYLLTDIGFVKYGEYGWKLLIAVMLIRPLADILPGIGLLHSLVPLRKEVGILSGLFIFIHSYAFFARKNELIFSAIFQAKNWSLESALTWGILGFITVIFLLLTSNNLSIRLLRGNWKRVQRLVYPLFFFSAVHIALVNKEEVFKAVLPVAVVFILWLMAHFQVRLPLFLKQKTSKPSVNA